MRLENSNPWKIGLTGSGTGLMFGAGAGGVANPTCPWMPLIAALGFTLALAGVLLPGRWFTRLVRS